MTPTDRLLIDTNVLIYAVDDSSKHHTASRSVLDRAQSENGNLCTAPQNFAEFFSLVTNPRRVTSPQSVEEALKTVEAMMSLPGLGVLPVPLDVVMRWIELCRKHSVKGAGIYDLQIVATMQANGVHRIATFDAADFQPFPEIEVVIPTV